MSLPPLPVSPTGGANPGAPARWTIYDPESGDSAAFVRNPKVAFDLGYGKHHLHGSKPKVNAAQSGVHGISSALNDQGSVLIYGQDEVVKGSIDGYIMSLDDWNFYQSWFNRGGPLVLTDDLGRRVTVLFETFSPLRVRKSSTPWFHTFKLAFVVTQTQDV